VSTPLGGDIVCGHLASNTVYRTARKEEEEERVRKKERLFQAKAVTEDDEVGMSGGDVVGTRWNDALCPLQPYNFCVSPSFRPSVRPSLPPFSLSLSLSLSVPPSQPHLLRRTRKRNFICLAYHRTA